MPMWMYCGTGFQQISFLRLHSRQLQLCPNHLLLYNVQLCTSVMSNYKPEELILTIERKLLLRLVQ